MTAEEAEVIQANRRFYEAFEAFDMDAMRRVWAQRRQDICVHPGWEILHGWREIRESLRAIFANTGFVRFELAEVVVEITGDIAQVSCVEGLFSVIEQQTIHSRVACTNLFLRTDTGWKMILHHGSPIASQPVMVDHDTSIN